MKSKPTAVIRITRPSGARAQRKAIASWLRKQASLVERAGDALAPQFTARYFAR